MLRLFLFFILTLQIFKSYFLVLCIEFLCVCKFCTQFWLRQTWTEGWSSGTSCCRQISLFRCTTDPYNIFPLSQMQKCHIEHFYLYSVRRSSFILRLSSFDSILVWYKSKIDINIWSLFVSHRLIRINYKCCTSVVRQAFLTIASTVILLLVCLRPLTRLVTW